MNTLGAGGRRLTLGIDVGSSNTKAVLAELDGASVRECAAAAVPTPDQVPALLAAVGEVVARVLAEAPASPEAIGVASMAESGAALDSNGAPLTPILGWDGLHGAKHAQTLARRVGAERLFAHTGVRPSGKAPLAVWLGLREQLPFAHWAGAADLVVHALSGSLVTDHTLAGRTMAYRVGGELAPQLDAELLALAGLRPEQLPTVARPGDTPIALDPSSVRRHGLEAVLTTARHAGPGLRSGTPVVAAGHDHAVAAWAAGVRHAGEQADSLGTAEAVLTVLPQAPDPGPVAAAGMSWVRSVSGERHALLAGSAAAGAMLGWLDDQLGAERAGAALAAAGEHGHEASGTALVLPYLRGRQTPAPDPGARVEILGEPRDDAALARAVVEGVCLQARWMLREQTRLGGVTPAQDLTVLGGPALAIPALAVARRHSLPFTQRRVTVAEPVATGAAMLAAVRAGLLGSPAIAHEQAPTLPVEIWEPTGMDDAAFLRFIAAATKERHDRPS